MNYLRFNDCIIEGESRPIFVHQQSPQQHHCANQNKRTHLKIRRTPTQTLNIHPPLLFTKPKTLQRPLLTQLLHLINILIPTIIPCARIALGILVTAVGAQCFEHSLTGEVFRCDEKEGGTLAGLFGFDEL